MPPFRTIPPVKPVKTERTHAENQERAYIAASRRSDRSLEARVESARRASEIHKKRTGRSLRVTEADVINEEMYEEEDDDLPAQIRRITAHLHTGNDPFNRRLQAYVANHIAMRSALGQVVADNWQQQQMQNNTINSYINPGMQQQNQFAFQQNPMLPPQAPARSPQMFRSSPYPAMPSPGGHARSNSMVTPQEARPMVSPHSMSAHNSPVDTRPIDQRRFSMPQQVDSKDKLGNRPGPLNLTDPIFSNPFGITGGMNFAPLTATLPLESQQLLAGAPLADLNDPAIAAMMQTHLVPTPGGNFTTPGFYSYNPNGSKKSSKANSPASNDGNKTTAKNIGMNATLAPSMLDVVQPTFPDETLFTPNSPAGFGMGFDAFSSDVLPQDGASSGQMTPGETDWNMWIESQALGDDTVAT